MTELPNWVYDLVMDLQEQEATHPSLYRMAAGGEWVRWDWCPANALDKVPADVQQAAEAIRGYRSRGSDSSAPADTNTVEICIEGDSKPFNEFLAGQIRSGRLSAH